MAIEWPRRGAFLRTVKYIARIPDDHVSRDHLSVQRPVPLSDAVAEVEAASSARSLGDLWRASCCTGTR